MRLCARPSLVGGGCGGGALGAPRDKQPGHHVCLLLDMLRVGGWSVIGGFGAAATVHMQVLYSCVAFLWSIDFAI